MYNNIFTYSTQELAKKLLNYAMLVVDEKGRCAGGRIVETESYMYNDPCSHSFRGKTKRNEAMFMQAGTIYVYQTYGIHLCINIVSNEIDCGEAVLIRAIEPIWGINIMQKRRNTNVPTQLCSGPGKLTQALGISLNHNKTNSIITSSIDELLQITKIVSLQNFDTYNTKCTQKNSAFPLNTVYLFPCEYSTFTISTSPRIGVTEKNPRAERYFIAENIYVSKYRVSKSKK